jgi:hypothetical protein
MLLNVDKVDPGFSAEQGTQGASRYVISLNDALMDWTGPDFV